LLKGSFYFLQNGKGEVPLFSEGKQDSFFCHKFAGEGEKGSEKSPVGRGSMISSGGKIGERFPRLSREKK